MSIRYACRTGPMRAMGNITAERRALCVIGRGVWWWRELNQQVAESGESLAAEMTHGLLRGVGHVAIETVQERSPRRGDPVDAAAAITGIGRSGDESIVFQSRHETGEIRIARDHSRADFRA